MSDIDWTAIGQALAAPFPKGTVKSANKGRKGTFDYIDARDVMDRLDAVVGPGRWSDFYRIIDLATGAVECTLSIHGVPRADVGYPNNPIGAKDKSGNPMSDEPLKDAYSDALKRAAVKFGIARYLYQDAPHPSVPQRVPNRPVVNPQTGEIQRPAAPPKPQPPQPTPGAATDAQKRAIRAMSKTLGDSEPPVDDMSHADAEAAILALGARMKSREPRPARA